MINLTLDDSRRLTGKSFIWDYPGAIMDVLVSGMDKHQVADLWQKNVYNLLQAVGWEEEKTDYRIFAEGISFVISAPLDGLYAATEINEVAWKLCCAELEYAPLLESLDTIVEQLKTAIAQESHPELLALVARAEAEDVPILVDDEEISLGYGASSQTWTVDQLPDPESLQWQKFHRIPVAMVTGTNGKSTTVRLAAEMVNLSGRCCGITSTDFIKVGNQVLDKGDYSGPMGARTLLKHSDTEVALLEVARGGLLRRGLPIPQADAALITNIAEDHLGQYGINNLHDLTRAKSIVAKALTDGPLILNADDAQLVELSKHLPNRIVWFSMDNNNQLIRQHVANGGSACFVDQEKMIYQHAKQSVEVMNINQVPITFDGAAKHNIQNALGAIALVHALNIDWEPIRHALQRFHSDLNDNPGRGNQFDYRGAKVIVDFAHNTHSMRAMADTIKNMTAKRKILLFSAAGDRSDSDIKKMTDAALTMQPEFIVIAEIEDYLRGREVGEVPELIANEVHLCGIPQQKIKIVESPVAGTEFILQQIEPQDLVLIMALTQRQQVCQLLQGAVDPGSL